MSYLLRCVEISDDGSEFKLVFMTNGGVVLKESESLYSFDDVLIVAYDFFKECCDGVSFDTRYDVLKVDISYSYDFAENLQK